MSETPAPNPDHLTLVEQLRALAGVSADTNAFEIVRERRTIRVVYARGSSESLTLKTKVPTATAETRRVFDGYRGGKDPGHVVAPRPLDIALRREDDDDKDHKAAGINVEVQTGDPQFDDAVYINTYAAPPGVVRKVLASPGVRAAARELLARDCTRFVIDDKEGDVSIDIVELTERTPDQERGARLVDNMVRLANALPQVHASGETPAEDPTLMPIGCGCLTALVGLIATPLLYVSRSSRGCRATDGEAKSLLCWSSLDCCNPGFTGLVFGAVLSLPVMFVLGRVIRGHSDSHASMRILQMTAFLLCCEIGVAVTHLLF